MFLYFKFNFNSCAVIITALDNQLSSVDYSSKLKTPSNLKEIHSGMITSPSTEKKLLLLADEKVHSYPPEITDAKPSTTQLDRKMSRSFKTAKRSTILGNADLSASLKAQQQTYMPARKESLQRRLDQHKELPEFPENSHKTSKHKSRRSVGLDDLPQMAAAVVSQPLSNNVQPLDNSMSRQRIYLSELSALQYMIIRYVAVVQLEKYVKGSFSSSELLNLIENKKSSIWGKFFTSFKKQKHAKGKEDGTFGVSLDVLTERTGVESNLGAGHSPVKLASFIDDSITAMRQMDMSVEGVFRKNGNIRRLKELTDALDKNPGEVDLTQENVIQVAALLKKFLRELPDPLLTHKLHKLFICAESKTYTLILNTITHNN
jgi:hypothetical protein